jgi:hypothetical protein
MSAFHTRCNPNANEASNDLEGVTSLLTENPLLKEEAMSQIIACMSGILTYRSIDARISA